MEKEEKGFSFSYSSERQREIDRIVSKYTDNSESKYRQLIKLDDSVETLATTCAILWAIVSILTFGFGLSIILVFEIYFLGTVFCATGIIMLFFIPKFRNFVLAKRRKAIAPKILEIAKEISSSVN